MRELSVYYCSKCGRYSYHHLVKNAVCPECSIPMVRLQISYQSFMDMEYSMRDKLIASQIIGEIVPKSSVVQRLSAYAQTCSLRIDAARFRTELVLLRSQNKLSEEEKEHFCEHVTMLLDENLALKKDLREKEEETEELKKKNEELNQTVQWMHDLIWKMAASNKKQQEDI